MRCDGASERSKPFPGLRCPFIIPMTPDVLMHPLRHARFDVPLSGFHETLRCAPEGAVKTVLRKDVYAQIFEYAYCQAHTRPFRARHIDAMGYFVRLIPKRHNALCGCAVCSHGMLRRRAIVRRRYTGMCHALFLRVFAALC